MHFKIGQKIRKWQQIYMILRQVSMNRKFVLIDFLFFSYDIKDYLFVAGFLCTLLCEHNL